MKLVQAIAYSIVFTVTLALVSCGGEAEFQQKLPNSYNNKATIDNSGDAQADKIENGQGSIRSPDDVRKEKKQQTPPPPTNHKDTPDTPDTPDDDISAVIEKFTGLEVPRTEKLDIIFMVDTSLSMKEEQKYLEKSMNKIIKDLVKFGVKDFKVFAVGTELDFSDEVINNPHFSHLKKYVGSHNALKLFLDIYDNGLVQPREKHTKKRRIKHFREDAYTELIVLTDDSSSLNASLFHRQLEKRAKVDLSFNAVVGLKKGRHNKKCRIRHVGKEYIKLANSKQYKGTVLNLCSPKWGRLLKHLAKHTEKRLKRTFKLSQAVNPEKEISITVEGTQIPRRSYMVNYPKGRISFKKNRTPSHGQEFSVYYTPKLRNLRNIF